jgi:hypothetical protein
MTRVTTEIAVTRGDERKGEALARFLIEMTTNPQEAAKVLAMAAIGISRSIASAEGELSNGTSVSEADRNNMRRMFVSAVLAIIAQDEHADDVAMAQPLRDALDEMTKEYQH